MAENWRPVDDTENPLTCACGEEQCWKGFDVADGGRLLTMFTDISDYSEGLIIVELPDNIRLCERIPAETEPVAQSGELLPCPFCGSAKVEITDNTDEDLIYIAMCEECGANVVHGHPKGAKAAWNRRAQKG